MSVEAIIFLSVIIIAIALVLTTMNIKPHPRVRDSEARAAGGDEAADMPPQDH